MDRRRTERSRFNALSRCYHLSDLSEGGPTCGRCLESLPQVLYSERQ
jgi:hypothetical protein